MFWEPCTIRDISRATFEIHSRWLNITIYLIPFCSTYVFLNCYSCSNSHPLHWNNFKNHRWSIMGFMVIFSNLTGISKVTLLMSLLVCAHSALCTTVMPTACQWLSSCSGHETLHDNYKRSPPTKRALEERPWKISEELTNESPLTKKFAFFSKYLQFSWPW